MCGAMWCPPLHIESDEQTGRMLFYMTAALRASNAHSMRVRANCPTVVSISREMKERGSIFKPTSLFDFAGRTRVQAVQDPYCEK